MTIFFNIPQANAQAHDGEDDRFIGPGEDINLTQLDPALRHVRLGVGWDANAFDAEAMDLDVSLFLLNIKDQTRVDEDFVFYNNLEVLDGAVKHQGDSRTGAGDGDDETILIDLQGVPFDIVRILVVMTIYQSYEKEQSLSMVRGAYIRFVNEENQYEFFRYNLDDQLKDRQEGGMMIAALDREEGPKWHFRSLAEYAAGGLPDLATRHGIIVKEKQTT